MTNNNLFNQEATLSTRGLSGTAELTLVASHYADQAIEVISTDYNTNTNQFTDLFLQSKTDGAALDTLVTTICPIDAERVQFLTQIDDETIASMLKSQQSKRSRCKSKEMTHANYRNMLIAAVSELAIRLVTNNEKSYSSGRRLSGTVEFTEEDLVQLEADQDKLRRELRNVQSKKSIMKRKEDFSEEDPKWLALLLAESQLKGIRVAIPTTKVDRTQKAISDLLGTVDISTLKAADAKALLENVLALSVTENQEETQLAVAEEVVAQ